MLVRLAQQLDEHIAAIGWPAISPDVRVPMDGDIHALVERIADSCGGDIIRLDGVRAGYEDGWALARASITEPVVTLRFEGNDQQAMRAVARRFLAAEAILCQKVMEILDE
jgi:phosphomannomutase/phosphoglucomutase